MDAKIRVLSSDLGGVLQDIRKALAQKKFELGNYEASLNERSDRGDSLTTKLSANSRSPAAQPAVAKNQVKLSNGSITGIKESAGKNARTQEIISAQIGKMNQKGKQP